MILIGNILEGLVIIALRVPFSLCFRSFTTEINTIHYEFNSKILSNFSLELLSCNDRNKINGSFSLAKNLNGMDALNWVTLDTKNGKQPTLYNLTSDVCKFVGKYDDYFNPVHSGVVKLIKKFIKGLPPHCPFKKSNTISVMGFYLDEDLLPPYLPDVNFTGFLGL
uniref:Uncharacterized protein n=1 Tax=Stomoxys calcitrans TaxID=35570 RepID=A0A1I8P3H6_STOCA